MLDLRVVASPTVFYLINNSGGSKDEIMNCQGDYFTFAGFSFREKNRPYGGLNEIELPQLYVGISGENESCLRATEQTVPGSGSRTLSCFKITHAHTGFTRNLDRHYELS